MSDTICECCDLDVSLNSCIQKADSTYHCFTCYHNFLVTKQNDFAGLIVTQKGIIDDAFSVIESNDVLDKELMQTQLQLLFTATQTLLNHVNK